MILPPTLPARRAAPPTIEPGAVWLDDRGKPIQAHGGGILKEGNTWFWFGEDRAQDLRPDTRAVACYASKDLVHWRFRRRVVETADPANLGASFVLERPKVYRRKTGGYAMFVHLDDARYRVASVGVFTSKRIDGAYRFVRMFRPLGQESRDIGQFVDDDGTNYLVFESRPTGGFYVAQLSDDGLGVAKETAFVKAPLEGGGLVHLGGLYYLVGSHMTGWDPNPNVYAAAPSLAGPWPAFKDLAPPEKKTYGAQSTMLVKVTGRKTTSVIFMGDVWKPRAQWDSRYLWMPLEIGDGRLRLPEPRPWTLDVRSGETAIVGP